MRAGDSSRPLGWLGALAFLFALSCGPDRGEVRVWKAEDHDKQAAANQGPAKPPPATQKKQASAQQTWTNRCARCHGADGKSNTDDGRRLNAPDLTRDDWLESVDDKTIAEVIRDGRKEMPAHPDLPDSVIQQLVQRIRKKGR